MNGVVIKGYSRKDDNMSRKLAREIGIKLLYQLDFEDMKISQETDVIIKGFLEALSDETTLKGFDNDDATYINNVIDGTISNLDKIDETIEKYSKEWTINRIAKVDLAILRLAIYEILFRSDIPKEVSINEAVELAKKYGSEDSKAFINGILGNVVKQVCQ